MDEEIINPTPLSFSTYFVDVQGKVRDGVLDLDDLVRKFPLDIQSEETDKGLVIKQGDNVLRAPYDVCNSTRKINKQNANQPTGFTKIIYPDNLETVSYSRPSEIIPTGCWCNSCFKVGPFGHKDTCSRPVMQSLRLTLTGFIKCFYSLENATVRKKLRNIRNEEIQKSITKYFIEVKRVEQEISGSEVYRTAAEQFSKNNEHLAKKLFNLTIDGIGDIATNITYATVHSFKSGSFWPGCAELQYHNEDHNKVSIRIYQDKLALVSCPWTQDSGSIIKKVISTINDTYTGEDTFEYTGSVVKNSNGKFRLYPVEANIRLDLDKVYDYFHPTDSTGTPIDILGRKETYKTEKNIQEGDTFKTTTTVNTYFMLGDTPFKYETVKEPKRGKMSIKSITLCERNGDEIHCFNIKVTAQIYNSGIIQLFFSYVDKNSATSSIDINGQLSVVEKSFEYIRDLFEYHFKQMDDDVYENVEPEKESAHIWNTVPGVIPYAKRQSVELGYMMEKFDTELDDWKGEYNLIVKVNKGTNKKPSRQWVLPRVEPVEKSDVTFLGKNNHTRAVRKGKDVKNVTLPLVELDDGTKAYSLESFQDGKDSYYVLPIGEEELEEIDLTNYRIYKTSFDTPKQYSGPGQVCAKSSGGVAMKPVPYSFYGQCQGGDQYIKRDGVRSRLDQKYYPCCVNISSKKTDDTKEEIEDANIEVDYIHGQPIEDKYAGTLVPGTNDIGNNVTFWNGTEWLDGLVSDRKKAHGVGSDNAHTILVVETVDEDNKSYEITGKDLHPKHRESRNFKGLRNIIEDEDEQKDLLINCAKKLNLIQPEINLEKADNKLQARVLKQLVNITGSKTYEEIAFGIEPFVSSRIKQIGKRAYEAVIIPENSLRTMLLITGSGQYLIDMKNKVMKVDFDIPEEYNNTLIDGFSTEDRVYYPIDLLYSKGQRVRGDYLKGSGGRLLELQHLVERIIRTRTPISLTIQKPLGSVLENAFIGPSDEEESLLNFVFVNHHRTGGDILFIPQTGSSKYMLWKENISHQDLILQLVIKDKATGGWWLGMKKVVNNKVVNYRFLTEYPLVAKGPQKTIDGKQTSFKQGDFVKLRINMMNNGEINPKKPYMGYVKTSKEESLSYEDAKLHTHTVIKRVDPTVFDDPESWTFETIMTVFMSGETSREPLREINV